MGTQSVSHMGLDCHKNFSRVTARDEQGRVVWRGRLEHANRQELKEKLAGWPKVPVVLEVTRQLHPRSRRGGNEQVTGRWRLGFVIFMTKPAVRQQSGIRGL